jgi:chromosome segregation ATPase
MQDLIPKELLENLGIDESIAIIYFISILVIILFIVMLVIVSSMRVKFYKDKFTNCAIDNEEKDETIFTLEQQLKSTKKHNSHLKYKLKDFDNTKQKLQQIINDFDKLKQEHIKLQDLYDETKTKLNSTKSLYESMMLEHQKLIEKYEELQETNNKLQVNNTRLLRKLEQK